MVNYLITITNMWHFICIHIVFFIIFIILSGSDYFVLFKCKQIQNNIFWHKRKTNVIFNYDN